MSFLQKCLAVCISLFLRDWRPLTEGRRWRVDSLFSPLHFVQVSLFYSLLFGCGWSWPISKVKLRVVANQLRWSPLWNFVKAVTSHPIPGSWISEMSIIVRRKSSSLDGKESIRRFGERTISSFGITVDSKMYQTYWLTPWSPLCCTVFSQRCYAMKFTDHLRFLSDTWQW